MESHSTIWVLVLLVLIMLSAFFSASETAFSSLNRIRLKSMANDGDKRAARTLQLSDRYDALLSAILIGNNIVNISSASIATVLFVAFLGDKGVTISTVVMTVVVLIFGEITPKSLAKQSAESVAMAFTPVLQGIVWVMTPLNWLFSQWKKLLNRVFRTGETPQISGDELMTLVEEVQNEGTIDADEGELIRAAIAFDDRDAADILTPRMQIEAVALSDSPAEICQVFEESGFSRLPVFDGTVDRIVGVLHEKDFYRAFCGGTVDVIAIMGVPVCVPPGMPLPDLLRELQKTKSHMAVVIDEFGGTLGIVTLEDVLEELVGEIWDEHDEVVETVQHETDGSVRVSCELRMDELFEQLDCSWECDAATVGGWVMEQLGTIPHTGDSFKEGGWLVTVTREGVRCAEEVRLTPLPEMAPSEDGDPT